MPLRTTLEIAPLDIRRVRQGLGYSQKRMGESIAIYIQGPGSSPIPGSRINEWEMRVRAIPDHVFVACARIVVDIWVKVRTGKTDAEVGYLDPKLAMLLSPALASAISFEVEYRGRRDKEGILVHKKALQIRKEVQAHFETLFMIDMANIFGVNQIS
jgi:hypothetical protein